VKPVKTVKPKSDESKTYVLTDSHDVSKELGRFTGGSPGVAAKKAVTRGHTNFLLRKTGEHDIGRHYTGKVVKIAPKTITRGGSSFTVTTKPEAKFVGTVKLV
jgi:hypothetical protein